MANNINREGFKRFLELGAPSFEGNIILDSGELSEYYYRFMRIPLNPIPSGSVQAIRFALLLM